ncbi:hypothetical protein B5F91_11050 [Bacteroides sp. An322]|nr:hypothetical protein B5F91_11050 [Bacteroides sp. An322]
MPAKECRGRIEPLPPVCEWKKKLTPSKNECPHFPKLVVGAYRIRPENIRMDKCVYSGVCNTPLHGCLRIFINEH